MSKNLKISLILLALALITRYNLRSYENIESGDWMIYMNESCAATSKGTVKSIFYNDLDLWSHVSVSMDSWKDSMAIEEPQTYCEYSSSEKRKTECLAYYQSRWDWYNRCYAIAKRNAYEARDRGEHLYD